MNIQQAIKTQWDRFARKEITVEQYIVNVNWIRKKIKKSSLTDDLKEVGLIWTHKSTYPLDKLLIIW